MISPTSEETSCFYESLLKNLSVINNIKLSNKEYSKVNETSNDLFEAKKTYLYFIANSKQVEELET